MGSTSVRTNPECEHPRDWVAVGAVSREPVSHVDKRIKDEYESPGSVPEYPASEASIDSASSSRRLENAIEKDFNPPHFEGLKTRGKHHLTAIS